MATSARWCSFTAGRRLDLDEAVAGASALEDVHRDEDVVRPERRLVDGRAALQEGLLRGRQPLGERVVRQVDEDPAGHVGARQLSDPGALVHHRGPEVVPLQLGRGRLVHHPPEELVALPPGHDPRLREADGSQTI